MSKIDSAEIAVSRYEILACDLTFERTIGIGSFGEVWIGALKNTGESVAIKKLHKLELDHISRELYFREITTLALAKHNFVLPFIGFTSNAPFCIVTKYICNDSLYNALRDDPRGLHLDATDLTLIAYGIANGMCFLHKKGIVHRDIKSQNILIDEKKLPVMCDFGSSRIMKTQDELKTSECGTPNYMAPEFIKAETYDEKVDVYSFSMVLWEMLTGKLPFDDLAAAQVIFAVLINHKRPKLPTGLPPPLEDMIVKCWNEAPEERYTFEEIVGLFESGEVMFPGCDQKIFQSKIEPFSKKRRQKGKFGTLPRYVKKNTGPEIINEDFQAYRTDRVQTPNAQMLADPHNLLNAYLFMLGGDNPSQISSALSYINKHTNDPGLLRTVFWPPILGLLLHSPPNTKEMVQKVAIKLAQSDRRLACLQSVTDLHIYIAPHTLDLFLYIVSFKTNLITSKVVSSISALLNNKDSEIKAVTLLSKIATFTANSEIYQQIIDICQRRVVEFVDSQSGGIMLKILNSNDSVTDDTIRKFFLSTIPSNCVAAYQALFIKDDKPNLLKMPTLLVHIVSDDEDLRGAACEFVRRFASQVDGEVLKQITDSLLTSVVQYGSDKAVLLLCRYALNEERARVFLLPGVSNIWLFAPPERAANLMKIFGILFRQNYLRTALLKAEELVTFLRSVLSSDDSEAVLAVCWAIFISKEDMNFLNCLTSKGATEILCKWFLRTRESHAVSLTCSALNEVAKLAFTPAFVDIVPHLLSLVNENSAASVHCLFLMEKISRYKETLDAFIVEGNAFAVLSRYQTQEEETKRCIRLIVDHFKEAGLLIPE